MKTTTETDKATARPWLEVTERNGQLELATFDRDGLPTACYATVHDFERNPLEYHTKTVSKFARELRDAYNEHAALCAVAEAALAEIERLYTGQPRQNFENNPVVKQLRAAIRKS